MMKPTDIPSVSGQTLPSYDVIIPTHQRAHVLEDSVRSALEQDYPASRIVIVDDGSIDESGAMILALARRFSAVVAVLLPRNGGASNARNVGISVCAAPWIAFLDSDDVWLPGAARAMLSATDDNSVDVVVGHFCRVEGSNAPGDLECGWDGGDIGQALAGGGVIGPSWSMIRRDVVLSINGFDPTFRNCNDWDFYTRAAASGARFTRINATVAHYRSVAGERLVEDHVSGETNAARVRAHPYLTAYYQ